jgi:hypothetical protein
MTREILFSTNREITVNIPEGWSATSDEKKAPQLLIWLVEENYLAAITLTEVKAAPEVRERLTGNGILGIGMVSLDLKEAKAKGSFEVVSPPQVFLFKGRNICAYEYTTDGRKTVNRIIVFDTGKRYYELAAIPMPKEIGGQMIDSRGLFTVQQSVLNSMRW